LLGVFELRVARLLGAAALYGHVGSLLAHAVGELATRGPITRVAAAQLNLVALDFFFILRHRYVQNTVFEACRNAAGIDHIGQLEGTTERAVLAFYQVGVAVVALVSGAALARKH
jgi:hypothetical protein